MEYDEFRLLVMPDIQVPGNWCIQVHRCPIAQEVGPKGSTNPAVTQLQLNRLRNASGWPDETALRDVGRSVWNSVMTPQASAAFHACTNLSAVQGRGLRLIVALLANATGTRAAGIPLSELPLEALFDNGFVATNEKTPVSRSLQAEPDRSPFTTAFPLRVLVVAAQPSDRPPVAADQEVAAIRSALQPLVDQRALSVDVCEPPTIEHLMEKLQEGYHVLHFIGHGSFEVVGSDPTPKPHLCFEDGTPARESVPIDGDQFYIALRNTNVQLVVLTSCSSAAPGAALNPYPVVAFEGIAQSVVEGVSGPSSAIAMQFDLETDAAAFFSGALYQALVKNEWALDEAVARARARMMVRFKTGHRCWMNPAVYWRCIGGKVFNLPGIVGADLSSENQRAITQIDAQLEAYYQTIRDIAAQPPQIREAAEPLRQQYQTKVDDLLRQRGAILGETVRLHGGKAGQDGSVECILTLRLRSAAAIGDVSVALQFDSAKISLAGCTQGTDTPGNPPFLQSPSPGAHTVLIRNVSRGAHLAPGEYELARIAFRLTTAVPDPVLLIRLGTASVDKDGCVDPTFPTMDAVVFPQ
jgi:hypothetical protein